MITATILVRGLNRLGDAVMSTPALQRLRQALTGRAHYPALSRKLPGLWQDQPFLDEVLIYNSADSVFSKSGRNYGKSSFRRRWHFPIQSGPPSNFCWPASPNASAWRARDTALFFDPGAAAATGRSPRCASGAMEKFETRIERESPADIFPAAAHQLHDYLYLTAELGASMEPLPPKIFVNNEQAAKALRELHLEIAAEGRPWLGLNPGAGARLRSQTLAGGAIRRRRGHAVQAHQLPMAGFWRPRRYGAGGKGDNRNSLRRSFAGRGFESGRENDRCPSSRQRH